MNNRCKWPGNDSLMIKYHDEEWGVPVHDDTKLFEFLILEAAQAGVEKGSDPFLPEITFYALEL